MTKKHNLKIGQEFNFKAVDLNHQLFDSKVYKSPLVISFFPKLNTKICDLQTLELSKWAYKYPNYKFIAISLDDIEIGKEWTKQHQVDNLTFLSDKKYRDFAKQTNLITDDQTMLWRGIVLLDKEHKVQALTVNDNLKVEPKYQEIEKNLKN